MDVSSNNIPESQSQQILPQIINCLHDISILREDVLKESFEAKLEIEALSEALQQCIRETERESIYRIDLINQARQRGVSNLQAELCELLGAVETTHEACDFSNFTSRLEAIRSLLTSLKLERLKFEPADSVMDIAKTLNIGQVSCGKMTTLPSAYADCNEEQGMAMLDTRLLQPNKGTIDMTGRKANLSLRYDNFGQPTASLTASRTEPSGSSMSTGSWSSIDRNTRMWLLETHLCGQEEPGNEFPTVFGKRAENRPFTVPKAAAQLLMSEYFDEVIGSPAVNWLLHNTRAPGDPRSAFEVMQQFSSVASDDMGNWLKRPNQSEDNWQQGPTSPEWLLSAKSNDHLPFTPTKASCCAIEEACGYSESSGDTCGATYHPALRDPVPRVGMDRSDWLLSSNETNGYYNSEVFSYFGTCSNDVRHWLKGYQPTINKDSPNITSKSFKFRHVDEKLMDWLAPASREVCSTPSEVSRTDILPSDQDTYYSYAVYFDDDRKSCCTEPEPEFEDSFDFVSPQQPDSKVDGKGTTNAHISSDSVNEQSRWLKESIEKSDSGFQKGELFKDAFGPYDIERWIYNPDM